MRVARTLSGIVLLIGAVLAWVAAGVLWAVASHVGPDGGFDAAVDGLSTPGYALVVPDVEALLRAHAPFARAGGMSVRVRAVTGQGPAFIGLAPLRAAQAYLGAAPYGRVDAVRVAAGPLPATVTQVGGTGGGLPAGSGAPASMPFWIARSAGGELSFVPSGLRGGPIALVLMRPDGAASVRLTASVGVRPGWLGPGAVRFAAAGTALAMVAVALLLWPVRSRGATGRGWASGLVRQRERPPERSNRSGRPVPARRLRSRGAAERPGRAPVSSPPLRRAAPIVPASGTAPPDGTPAVAAPDASGAPPAHGTWIPQPPRADATRSRARAGRSKPARRARTTPAAASEQAALAPTARPEPARRAVSPNRKRPAGRHRASRSAAPPAVPGAATDEAARAPASAGPPERPDPPSWPPPSAARTTAPDGDADLTLLAEAVGVAVTGSPARGDGEAAGHGHASGVPHDRRATDRPGVTTSGNTESREGVIVGGSGCADAEATASRGGGRPAGGPGRDEGVPEASSPDAAAAAGAPTSTGATAVFLSVPADGVSLTRLRTATVLRPPTPTNVRGVYRTAGTPAPVTPEFQWVPDPDLDDLPPGPDGEDPPRSPVLTDVTPAVPGPAEPAPADRPVDPDPWPAPPSSSPDPFVLRPGPDPAWD